METKVGKVCLLATRDKFKLPRNAFKLWLVFPTASFNFRFVFLTVDGIDEGVEEDIEDDFEQVLAENIDGATQKR